MAHALLAAVNPVFGLYTLVQGAGVSQSFPNPDGKILDVSGISLAREPPTWQPASLAALQPVAPARARR